MRFIKIKIKELLNPDTDGDGVKAKKNITSYQESLFQASPLRL